MLIINQPAKPAAIPPTTIDKMPHTNVNMFPGSFPVTMPSPLTKDRRHRIPTVNVIERAESGVFGFSLGSDISLSHRPASRIFHVGRPLVLNEWFVDKTGLDRWVACSPTPYN